MMVIPRSQIRIVLIVFFIVLFVSQGCAGMGLIPTSPSIMTQTAILAQTETPWPTAITPVSTSTFVLPATSVPLGVFALLIYPPLIMNYDASAWIDESNYSDVSFKPGYSVLNYLQSLNFKSCQIGVQGPTDFQRATPESVQLDLVKYQTITFRDTPPGSITVYYIEDKSLKKFNYDMGTSVLVVQADITNWERCKALAEKVLSTLHVP